MSILFPKFRFFPVVVMGFACLSVGATISILNATDSGDDASESSEETVSGLPAWEEGDFREGFEVRIWPEQVVLWLEQENLRDLIADPETPEAEKADLRRILAMQQVWPTRF